MSKKKNNNQVAPVNPFDVDFNSIMQEMALDYENLTPEEKAQVDGFFKGVAGLAQSAGIEVDANLALELAENDHICNNCSTTSPPEKEILGYTPLRRTPIKGCCDALYWIAEDLSEPKYSVRDRVWYSLQSPFRFCEGIVVGYQIEQIFSSETGKRELQAQYFVIPLVNYEGIEDLITFGYTIKKPESELFETVTDLRTYWDKQLEQAIFAD